MVFQLAEDVILLNWRKAVGLADAYSTGSSLMPQKKILMRWSYFGAKLAVLSVRTFSVIGISPGAFFSP